MSKLVTELDTILTKIFKDVGDEVPVHAIESMLDCVWFISNKTYSTSNYILWYDYYDSNILKYNVERIFTYKEGSEVTIAYGTRSTSDNMIAFILNNSLKTTEDKIDNDLLF